MPKTEVWARTDEGSSPRGGAAPASGCSCSVRRGDRYSDPAAVHSVFFESPLFITAVIAGHFNRFCIETETHLAGSASASIVRGDSLHFLSRNEPRNTHKMGLASPRYFCRYSWLRDRRHRRWWLLGVTVLRQSAFSLKPLLCECSKYVNRSG